MDFPLSSWEEEVGTRAAGRLVLRAIERVREGTWSETDLDAAVRVTARRLTGRQSQILAAALHGTGDPALAAIARRRLAAGP